MLNKINRKNTKIYYKGKNKKAILILNGFATSLTETDLVFNYFKKKGYTVARPKFHTESLGSEKSRKCGPEEWLVEAKAWLKELEIESDGVYIIGYSFGSNLGASLLVNNRKKIKGFVGIEMPVIFNCKFLFLARVVQPIFNFFKIKQVRKDSVWYRGKKANIELEEEGYSYVRVDLAGLIRDYVNKRTKVELMRIKTPFLIVQAVKSDVLAANNAKYIYDKLMSEKKEVYYVPLENHDFNLLDDANKVIMLEKIFHFINEI